MGNCCGKNKKTELKIFEESFENINANQKNNSSASLKDITLKEQNIVNYQMEVSVKDFDTKQKNENILKSQYIDVPSKNNQYESNATKNQNFQSNKFSTTNKSPLITPNKSFVDIEGLSEKLTSLINIVRNDSSNLKSYMTEKNFKQISEFENTCLESLILSEEISMVAENRARDLCKISFSNFGNQKNDSFNINEYIERYVPWVENFQEKFIYGECEVNSVFREIVNNSQSNLDDLLNKKWTHVGAGYSKHRNYDHCIVVQFTKKKENLLKN